MLNLLEKKLDTIVFSCILELYDKSVKKGYNTAQLDNLSILLDTHETFSKYYEITESDFKSITDKYTPELKMRDKLYFNTMVLKLGPRIIK